MNTMRVLGVAAVVTAGVMAILGSATPVNKTPVPSGGSKADGTVELVFDYGQFEKPEIDWATADKEAKAKCAAWGYLRADKFGAGKFTCVGGVNEFGCIRTQVTVTYQCIGLGDKKVAE